MATISSAATTSVHSVRPETGLFDDPIMPTRLPGDGGEEEAEHDHHDRRHHRAAITPAK